MRCSGWYHLICGVGLLLTGCVRENITPISVKTDLTQAAMLRNTIGMECLQMGDIEKAQMELEHARQLAPNLAETYNGLGLVYAQEGDTKRADRNFQRSLDLDPNNGQAQTDYGDFLFHQGRLEQSCTHFAIASQNVLYANRALAFENLGLCYEGRNMQTQAQAAFIRALRLNSRMQVSTLELTELFFDQGDYPRAEAGYKGYQKMMGTRLLPAKALWLGWRIAHLHGDMNGQVDFAMKLKALYPQSTEYKAYCTAMGMAEMPGTLPTAQRLQTQKHL